MKLCDKCFELGDHIKATDQVSIESTQECFDLCESCVGFIRDFINDRTGRIGKDAVKAEKKSTGSVSSRCRCN